MTKVLILKSLSGDKYIAGPGDTIEMDKNTALSFQQAGWVRIIDGDNYKTIENHNVFPKHLLKSNYSALCLFTAAFAGIQDVWFIQNAGIKEAVLIDNDTERLSYLATQFPDYTCIPHDAFDFINEHHYKKGRLFDIITSDQWSGLDGRVWAMYSYLKSMATKHLIISVCQESIDSGLKLPDGELIKRSNFKDGVYWHITNI